jgi:Xaa-Pro dipeptidase
MKIGRRNVLTMAGATAALAALAPSRIFAADATAALKSMTVDVAPIERTEYLARIDKARAQMGKLGIGALLIEPGASLVYFTGVQWWRSERLTAAVLTREGDISIVTPHFEEPSVRESLADQGPSCCVMTAHTSMNLGLELPSLLFGYTSLEDASSAFLI